MTETVFAKRARLFIILQETRKAKLASHKEKLLKVISLLASLAYGSCDVRELLGRKQAELSVEGNCRNVMGQISSKDLSKTDRLLWPKLKRSRYSSGNHSPDNTFEQ